MTTEDAGKPGGADQPGAHEGESLGTAAEEAAKLLDALRDWARRTGGVANAHIATGAPECRLCPICQLISVLRESRPEVVDHLTDVAGSLAAAVRALLEAQEREWSARRSPGVERINVG